MATLHRLEMAELIERAARGVGKVDHHGERGVTNVSHQEVEAMALMLAILNVPQLAPGSVLDDASRATLIEAARVAISATIQHQRELMT